VRVGLYLPNWTGGLAPARQPTWHKLADTARRIEDVGFDTIASRGEPAAIADRIKALGDAGVDEVALYSCPLSGPALDCLARVRELIG